eukprot:355140-Chlamydomonas_euryale.AAC.2
MEGPHPRSCPHPPAPPPAATPAAAPSPAPLRARCVRRASGPPARPRAAPPSDWPPSTVGSPVTQPARSGAHVEPTCRGLGTLRRKGYLRVTRTCMHTSTNAWDADCPLGRTRRAHVSDILRRDADCPLGRTRRAHVSDILRWDSRRVQPCPSTCAGARA